MFQSNCRGSIELEWKPISQTISCRIVNQKASTEIDASRFVCLCVCSGKRATLKSSSFPFKEKRINFMDKIIELCKKCIGRCCYERFVPIVEEDLRREVLLEDDNFKKRAVITKKDYILTFTHKFLKMKMVTQGELKRAACIFLDTKLEICSIWENRPNACRSFDCKEDAPNLYVLESERQLRMVD